MKEEKYLPLNKVHTSKAVKVKHPWKRGEIWVGYVYISRGQGVLCQYELNLMCKTKPNQTRAYLTTPG